MHKPIRLEDLADAVNVSMDNYGELIPSQKRRFLFSGGNGSRTAPQGLNIDNMLQAFEFSISAQALDLKFIKNLHAIATQSDQSIPSGFLPNAGRNLDTTGIFQLEALTELKENRILGQFVNGEELPLALYYPHDCRKELPENVSPVFNAVFYDPELRTYLKEQEISLLQNIRKNVIDPSSTLSLVKSAEECISYLEQTSVPWFRRVTNNSLKRGFMTPVNASFLFTYFLTLFELDIQRLDQINAPYVEPTLNSIIEKYTRDINNSRLESDRLLAIIDCVRRFEFSHPFVDGNTRTFVLLLLNKLLIDNGFCPVFLNEKQTITFASCVTMETLVNTVIKGQERFVSSYHPSLNLANIPSSFMLALKKLSGGNPSTLSQEEIQSCVDEKEKLRIVCERDEYKGVLLTLAADPNSALSNIIDTHRGILGLFGGLFSTSTRRWFNRQQSAADVTHQHTTPSSCHLSV